MSVQSHQWVLHGSHRDSHSLSAADAEFSLDHMTHGRRLVSVTPVHFSMEWFVQNVTAARGNQTFELKEVTSSAVWSITVPEDYYSPSSLAAYLQNELRTMTAPGSAAFVQAEFAVTYDAEKGKFTIAADTTASGNWQLVSSSSTTLLTQMGFGSQMDTNLSDSVTATNMSDTEVTHILQVYLDGLRNTYCATTNANLRSVLLTIPVDVGHTGLLTWEANPHTVACKMDSAPHNLHIRLLDKEGNVLVTNDRDWTLVLKAVTKSHLSNV